MKLCLVIFIFVGVLPSADAYQNDEEWFAAEDWDLYKAKCLDPVPMDDEILWQKILEKFDVDDLETAFGDLNPELKTRLIGTDRTTENYAKLLQTGFEDKSGLLVWLRLNFGFNGLLFRKEELESLLVGFKAFPEGFRAPKENLLLKRVRKIDDGVLANATLTFSGLWGSSPYPKRVYTVIHELGHRLDFGASDSVEWQKIRGMKVSEYAEKNQWEDFAESVAAYRLQPYRLKSSPEKYEWIRWQVFGGQEFIHDSDCETKSVLSPVEEISNSDVEELSAECEVQILPSLVAESSENSEAKSLQNFSNCINKEVRIKKIKEIVPPEYLKRTLEVAADYFRPSKIQVSPSLVAEFEKSRENMKNKFDVACRERIETAKAIGCFVTDSTHIGMMTRDPLTRRISWQTEENRLIYSLKSEINSTCLKKCETELTIASK